jgi:hypothetical protein
MFLTSSARAFAIFETRLRIQVQMYDYFRNSNKKQNKMLFFIFYR